MNFFTALNSIQRIGKRHGNKFSNSEKLDAWQLSLSKYQRLKKMAIIDLFLDSVNLTNNILKDPVGNYNNLLVRQAIQDTNPEFDFDNPPTGENLLGIINSSKGRYFEYLVANKLNSGLPVGDLILPSGYSVKLADSMNQPGWDLSILDEEGNISSYLQLKATNSIYYIKDALDKYPNIEILSTSEVAKALDDSSLIFNSDISNDFITQQIEEGLVDSQEQFIDVFFETFSPLLPLAVILSTEAFSILIRKKDLKRSIQSTFKRGVKSVTSQAVASVVYSSGGGLLSIPAGIFTRFILEIYDNFKKVNLIISKAKMEILQLRIYQQERALKGG